MGDWLNLGKATPDQAVRLVCLPYAGGGAGAYRDWANHLPENIGVLAAQPPGRENRFHEPPIDWLPTYVEQLRDALSPLLDRPYAVFGHSIGARLGFELCRLLRRDGTPPPVRLYLSGCPAPHLPGPPPRWNLPDEAFIEELRGLNGTPPELFESPGLLALFLPMLRADFGLVERYPHRDEAALPVPIRTFAGRSDPEAEPASVTEWAAHTSAGFESYEFDGDHFFLHEHRAALLRLIAADLAAAPAGRPQPAPST
jgi:medium-chain acyl-[acyl-carrier-protein] hydrolase